MSLGVLISENGKCLNLVDPATYILDKGEQILDGDKYISSFIDKIKPFYDGKQDQIVEKATTKEIDEYNKRLLDLFPSPIQTKTNAELEEENIKLNTAILEIGEVVAGFAEQVEQIGG